MPPVDAAPARPAPPVDARPAQAPGGPKPPEQDAPSITAMQAEQRAQAAADSAKMLGEATITAMGQPPDYDQGVKTLAQGVPDIAANKTVDTRTVRPPQPGEATQSPAAAGGSTEATTPASPSANEPQTGTLPTGSAEPAQPAVQTPNIPTAGNEAPATPAGNTATTSLAEARDLPTTQTDTAASETTSNAAKEPEGPKPYEQPATEMTILLKKIIKTPQYRIALGEAQGLADARRKADQVVTDEQIQQDAIQRYYEIRVEDMTDYDRAQAIKTKEFQQIHSDLADKMVSKIDMTKLTRDQKKEKRKEIEQEALKMYLYGQDTGSGNWLAKMLAYIAAGSTVFLIDNINKFTQETNQ